MGFLDRLRGNPDVVGAPPVAASGASASSVGPTAGKPGSTFELGALPQPHHDVYEAVAAGELLSAIKAYRFQSGTGLAEAKAIIDAMARGDRLVASVAADDAEDPEAAAQRSAATWARIDELIAQGHKIAAVKVHRDAHGTSLADAKRAVETRMHALEGGGA